MQLVNISINIKNENKKILKLVWDNESFDVLK